MCSDRNLHSIGSVGRAAGFWDDEHENVTVNVDGEFFWYWTDEPTLSDLTFLFDQIAANTTPLNADEMTFILGLALSVEAHQEHANKDLREHGQVGVTY